jgi:glycosyltransferase involved in cell wall biosynthesis
MISVIIATRNRSAAIAEISLPSLLRQDCRDFEIIIWDASDDESTRNASCELTPCFKDRGIDLIYRKAPRVGLASQRNDSVREARGDAVLFIDDDCGLLSDAVSVVMRYFSDFEWLMGLGLPLIDKLPRIDKYVAHPVLGFARDLLYIFFMGSSSSYRKMRNSTKNALPTVDAPGKAEWLSGGCMAFRKTIFTDMTFDERLQTFGGYSYGEDVDFSHRVFLRYGDPLLVASGGSTVHYNSASDRNVRIAGKCAAMFYNTAVIRENFVRFRKYRLLPFLWELRIGLVLSMIAQGTKLSDILKGYSMYRKIINSSKPGKS